MNILCARGDYVITNDRERIDMSLVHDNLRRSYWSPGIPREVVARGVANSLCFSMFLEQDQVGFARVISDKATFAYLADVFVTEDHRGRGLGTWLVETIRHHPDLQGLRRFMLATRDAHSLYRRFGFTPLANPARMMEVLDTTIYESNRIEPAGASSDATGSC